MSDRKKVRITPNGEKWKVKVDGNQRPNGLFDRKVDAVEAGRDIAKGAEKGQLIIHKQNGQIQTEYTYGKDPEKYPG